MEMNKVDAIALTKAMMSQYGLTAEDIGIMPVVKETEKPHPISWERLCEIATKFKDAYFDLNDDDSEKEDFVNLELEMTDEEKEFFGIKTQKKYNVYKVICRKTEYRTINVALPVDEYVTEFNVDLNFEIENVSYDDSDDVDYEVLGCETESENVTADDATSMYDIFNEDDLD